MIPFLDPQLKLAAVPQVQAGQPQSRGIDDQVQRLLYEIV
jgi:hypothetical protein